MEGQNYKDRYVCVWEVLLKWLISRVIEIRYLSFLVRESKCMPYDGIEHVCRVVIGCMQPEG